LLKAFADGKALEPFLARDIREGLDDLPDWQAYQDKIIARVYSGVDGIGNESIDAVEALNKGITLIEDNLVGAIKNTVV